MRRPTWDPPAESVTDPDQIEEGALDAIDLLEGERIVRCWKTAIGFLVMTTLRCQHLWHRPQLFADSEWHQGPSFFFYNLAPPALLAGRFVELAEQGGVNPRFERYLVRDPEEVRAEIDAARPGGRAEWERRRKAARSSPPGSPMVPPGAGDGVVTEVVREVVRVRCRFCGNLMAVSDLRCSACGAPQS